MRPWGQTRGGENGREKGCPTDHLLEVSRPHFAENFELIASENVS